MTSRAHVKLWALLIVAFAIVGCSQPDRLPKSIGAATMLEDGTLQLHLRAEAPGGTVGEALIVVKRDDPRYADYLRHVGGLKPGESKPVPPWPESK